jgi:TfoX/Sxy family transcriptional regulator of competence genes
MYDQHLADRIRWILKNKNITFSEKEMMGGLACMVNDKMCVGITDNRLMARIDPVLYEDALTKKGCRPMDFTGRPMRGWIYIEPDGIDLDGDLNYWIQLALDYNPKAKSSKRKKK